MPNCFSRLVKADVPEVRQTIVGDWSAQVRTYHVRHSNPNEHLGLIYHQVHAFLVDCCHIDKR